MLGLIFTIIFGVFKGALGLLKLIFGLFILLFSTKIVRVIIITVLAVIVPLGIIYYVSPDLGSTVAASAFSAVNTTTLYKYSKDVYLDSIIHGSVRVFDYKTSKETPYYSAIITKDKLEETEPAGVLPVDSNIELRSYFAMNNKEEDEEEEENIWTQIFFLNEEEKPQYAYVLLPAAEISQLVPVKPAKKPKAVYATVTAQLLNVRSGPSANHDILDGLQQNTRVEILETYENSWVKIKYGDKTGYVYSELLEF